MAGSVSLQELLTPQVIMDVISRIRMFQGRLSQWLGFQPRNFNADSVQLSGPNTVAGTTRAASWRIYDNTRVAAKLRAPGTGPATVALNPVGQQDFECARYHEKVVLEYEQLGNQSAIMGPNSQIDAGGQDYIRRQTASIAQQFNVAVEIMAVGMLRGGFWMGNYGDDWIVSLSDPTGNTGLQYAKFVDYKVPAGNKSQLNMLGDGNIIQTSWANPAAPIFSDLMNIKKAFARLTGYPLTDCWISSPMWNYIVNNTQIRNLAGSAASPQAEYKFIGEKDPSGVEISEYAAILRADPTITWHITDENVVTGNTDIDPTWATAPATAGLQSVIPDTNVLFLTKPAPEWTKMYHGAEYVVENPGMPGVLRKGYYFWSEFTTQPSAIELLGVLNALPLLYIPKIVANGTVVF